MNRRIASAAWVEFDPEADIATTEIPQCVGSRVRSWCAIVCGHGACSPHCLIPAFCHRDGMCVRIGGATRGRYA